MVYDNSKCNGGYEVVSLEEFKKIVEQHMKKELDIMEMIFYLDTKDVQAFNEWYINHPYCKGIDEVKEIVRDRTGNKKTKRFSDKIIRS